MGAGEVTPWPGFDVERTSVRVVVLDEAGRFLLFRTIDPTMPETGVWWELPGGGLEPGETYADTAERELREETGFVVELDRPADQPRWTRDSTYVRRHVRTWQHEVVVVAHVAGSAPAPSPEGRTAYEREEYVDHRWWSLEELAEADGERFFPGRLRHLLPGFLGGGAVDEPFDHWN